MIILDTNVLAALMRTVPEAPVVAWLDRQPAESDNQHHVVRGASRPSAAAVRPAAANPGEYAVAIKGKTLRPEDK